MYNYAVLFVVSGQLIVTYVPFFQHIFATESLTFGELVFILVLSSSVLWVDECIKLVIRMGGLKAVFFKMSLWFASSSLGQSITFRSRNT